jgi:hypothetical protein
VPCLFGSMTGLPLQKKHKEELETQLAEVERDIKTLERGEVILVVHEL